MPDRGAAASRRTLVILVAVVLGGYALLCLVTFVMQDQLVYFPERGLSSDPGDHGLAFEDVSLAAEDGTRLHAWFLPARATPARGVVLFLHGNGGNIESRLPSAAAFLDMGLACLLVDYRGYGRSEGRPDEEGTYQDAVAAHDHLVRERGFPPERIVVYGESLGGAVAVELAKRRPVGVLFLESTFRSLPAVARRHYPWLPVDLLSRYRYDSEAKIADLDVPVLVAHSPADEIVPWEHGRALYERARGPKAFLETEAGHNDGGFLRRPAWRATVAAFLAEHLPPAAADR